MGALVERCSLHRLITTTLTCFHGKPELSPGDLQPCLKLRDLTSAAEKLACVLQGLHVCKPQVWKQVTCKHSVQLHASLHRCEAPDHRL